MNKGQINSWKVIFEPQIVENPQFDEFAESFFDVVTVDYVENGQIQYSGYSSRKPEERYMRRWAKQLGVDLPAYRCESIAPTNWLTYNVIKFPPIETEDFLIYGVHEKQIPTSTKHRIRIYAATAFGSGQHQTTQSCLKLLSFLHKNNFCPDNILDMGCGSGILALSACRLWPKVKALCADIDPESVAVTLQNAQDNKLKSRIKALQSDGFQNSQIAAKGPYQLVLCNILARPLIAMAQDLARNLSKGGYAVLSGFVDEQTEWVQKAYEAQGLYPIKIVAAENWRALLMEKRK